MKTKWWIIGYVIALAVALASPLASSEPDGLERVAEDHEFIALAEEPGYEIIPDYAFPGIENEALATMVAGVAGVTLLFVLLYGGSWLMLKNRTGSSGGAARSQTT